MHRLYATAACCLVAIAAVPAARAEQRQDVPPLVIASVAGRDNFERYCASCHGAKGRGDGPVASALKAQPADLTGLAARNGGSYPRERVAAFVSGTGRPVQAHGPSDMPVWGPVFRALDRSDARASQRLDNVVAYIETLQVPARGKQ